jgi:hypothetical protein
MKYSLLLFGVVILIYLLPIIINGPFSNLITEKYVGCCKLRKSLLLSFTFLINFLPLIDFSTAEFNSVSIDKIFFAVNNLLF